MKYCYDSCTQEKMKEKILTTNTSATLPLKHLVSLHFWFITFDVISTQRKIEKKV